MKTVNDQNQIWYEEEDGNIKVGFTRSFLDGLDQCWHILPANLEKFRAKTPLMLVETNDSLISILAPVSGFYANWNTKAQNFPDRLTETDVVLEMSSAPRGTRNTRTRSREDEIASTVTMTAAQHREMLARAGAPPRALFTNTTAGTSLPARPMTWSLDDIAQESPEPPIAVGQPRRTGNRGNL